jgi:hypothetical protein
VSRVDAGHVIKVDGLAGSENASTFHGHEHGTQVSLAKVGRRLPDGLP